PASASAPFTVGRAAPAVRVADAGGTYGGGPFPATAAVAGAARGVDDTPGPTLEGVGLALDYLRLDADGGTTDLGSSAPSVAGTPALCPAPPAAAGTCLVVASPARRPAYAPASAGAPFTVARATPAVSVVDAGGAYGGGPFPATAAVAGAARGVEDTPGPTLE